MDYSYEKIALSKGYKRVCGIDEVGRGPIAGPVVACACTLPLDKYYPIDDSKKLSPKARLAAFDILTLDPEVSFAIGVVSPERIDEINILQASLEAMQIAYSQLIPSPDFALVDGNKSPKLSCKTLPIIGGDGISMSIAAASILAKVIRDSIMDELDPLYPEYGFGKHKGYPTKEHIQKIRSLGIIPGIYRKTFAPVAEVAEMARV